MAVNHRVVVVGALLGALLGSGAAAQPEPVDRLLVRDVATVGTLERVEIGVRLGLAPRVKVLFPFFAYGADLICGQERPPRILAHQKGPAAIVNDFEGDPWADLYRTVDDAVRAAQDRCNDGSAWELALTHRLDAAGPTTNRYLSREVRRIEESLRDD